ncbi:SCP2 sterol-binding domain-containing protein [Pelomonas sp. KK5]|uniref:SCP2 sterol-binding domain-containing protein n=1 Tax=Pelomonas sp. KK5 TaxID=1855730 RepID=UPI00097CA4E0|nr:SCP2 sterol-binding domain-containing protein [Pelomonas sp. KK5]
MDMQAITAALAAKAAASSSSLDATLKFDCGDEGIVYLDGNATPNAVDNVDRPADCTVKISRDNLAALLAGTLNPMNGFMTGKIRIDGDMGVAMKLSRFTG